MSFLSCCKVRQSSYKVIRDPTPQELAEYKIDRSVGDNWSRTKGSDNRGLYSRFTLKTRDSSATIYQFTFKLRTQNDLENVLFLKSFKSLMKSLSLQNAKFLAERISKYNELPRFKIVKNKDRTTKGIVTIFPGNKYSHGVPYTFFNDGTMVYFMDKKPLKEQEINDLCREYINKQKAGYVVSGTHKGQYKFSRGIPPGFTDTRLERANCILAELNSRNTAQSVKVSVDIELTFETQ